MKFIGTKLCPDCIDAESVLKQACVKFEYLDITTSMENMKLFMKLRDNREEFNNIKAEGYIGIPCFLMDDGRILFDENKVLNEEAVSA